VFSWRADFQSALGIVDFPEEGGLKVRPPRDPESLLVKTTDYDSTDWNLLNLLNLLFNPRRRSGRPAPPNEVKIDANIIPWPTSIAKAGLLQRELSRLVRLSGDLSNCDLIAGADCASVTGKDIIAGAVVVWQKSSSQVIAQATAVIKTNFPYISGLLAFRELPVLLAAFQELTITPEAVIVDGQGWAHPRRLGIACHLGLYLRLPTIGCGKTHLYGSFTIPEEAKGSRSLLFCGKERLGYVLRTRAKVSPVFISPGHKCSLEAAADLVLECCTATRLPEPIRAAHRLAGETLKSRLNIEAETPMDSD